MFGRVASPFASTVSVDDDEGVVELCFGDDRLMEIAGVSLIYLYDTICYDDDVHIL